MGSPTRSIPLDAARKIAVSGQSRSVRYARHWLELLGCEPSDRPVEGGIAIVDGNAASPVSGCAIRLWDFQVGYGGTGTLASAVSGAAAVIGSPDRPGVPLPVDMPEKWCAAYGVILALAELWRTEMAAGQVATEYDVSAADVLRAFSLQNSGDAEKRARLWRRNGRVCVERGGIFPMGFYACKDGYVALLGRSRRDWRHIRKTLGDPVWAQDPRFDDPFAIAKDSTEADALLEETLGTFSRDALLRRGLEERAVIAPVYSAAEAETRSVFRDAFLSDGKPSMPFLVEPLSGKTASPQISPRASAGTGPLAGLRCLELCWVWSGPMVGQILADLGAEVIKVETPKRFDLYRTRGLETKRGLMDERTRIESSLYFHSLNRNKIGLSLDLKRPEGLELAKSLIGISDLVIENFTVGTMDRLGLGTDTLAAANPAVVQLSMSGPGRGSAVEALRSYGLVLSALGGAEILIEEEGAFVGSPTFSISDPNAAVFGAMAAIAGALSARRNGQGLALDLSQIEAAATLANAPVPDRETIEGIARTNDGAIIGASVPPGAFADGTALRRALENESQDTAIRMCSDAGGHGARFRELDDSEKAQEFADCSAWVTATHPYTGNEPLVAAPWRVGGNRSPVRQPAPLLGELLLLDDAEIAALTEAGVVSVPELEQPAPPKRKKAKT